MSLPHNEQELGRPLRNKKKRSAVFIVVAASIAAHVLAGLGLAAVKIIEVLQPEAEFEAPPVVAVKPPPPPPPPPPTTKRAQRSLPRPQPLLAQNPQNLDVPAIEMNDSNLTIGGGRGFGGGLGALGGGVADSIRITSFGFDQALEGTLTGVLYDLKRNKSGREFDTVKDADNMKQKTAYGAEVVSDFARSFNLSKFDRNFTKSTKSLYASYFVIPSQSANVAPKSFSAEKEIEPSLIAAVYTGSYKPVESGRFRFVGKADDVLLIRVNGKLVLDGSWAMEQYSNWRPSAKAKQAIEEDQSKYFGLGQPIVTGDWFDLTAGVATEIDVLIAEIPGGQFGAYILIEKEGELKKRIFTTRPLRDEDKDFLRKTHRDAGRFLD
ncbi:MAG: hypothetical protein ACSHX8_16000 [Opitutaceae bacterium]